MTDVVLYGPRWSAYTRTAILTLMEKGVAHAVEEVDFSGGRGMPPEHLARHPFAKVPALRHGDYWLYETSAICRYVDAAFDGPALQPAAPRALGRMAQIVAILDAYLSAEIRMGYVSERLTKPLMGLATDEARVAEARAAIEKGFPALEACLADASFMVGDELSLADLHAAPLIGYLVQTPGGPELIAPHPRLVRWWDGIAERASVVATRPDLTAFGRQRH
jgi:glutathione S-transferase